MSFMPVITQQIIASAKVAAKPGAVQSEITDTKSEGLRLRVGARGVRWQLRFKIAGVGSRLDLGGVDEWTIPEARDLAGEAQRVIRAGLRRPDDAWLYEQRIRLGKAEAPATPQEDTRLTLKWTWEDAVTQYLAEVKRTLKPATHTDYRNMLGTPELQRFAGKPVASISRQAMSLAIADVFKRGVERHADHLASVIRPMWKFLQNDNCTRLSGVTEPVMLGLEAPRRSRAHATKKPKFTPPMWQVGRMLIIARSGVFHPVIGAALELMLFTCQRVLPISTANIDEFRSTGDHTEGLWFMPPHHRKTAEKRGDDNPHILPLPAAAWAPVQRMLDLTDDGSPNPYLFRGMRPRRAGDEIGAMASSNLSHAMMYSPGIESSPHDLRRSLSRLAAAHFKWSIDKPKMVLDHNEGRASGDVTVVNYLFDGTHEKWPLMRQWCDWVEEHAALELQRDTRLQDLDWLKRTIGRSRDEHKKGIRLGVSLAKPSNMSAGNSAAG